MTSNSVEPLLVTAGSAADLRELVESFAHSFERDYDLQEVESVENGETTTVLYGWEDEDQVYVLLPAEGAARYAGALGFSLGVDNWSFDWAFLEPSSRHLGLIERHWLAIRNLLYDFGYPHISDGAASVTSDGPVSPAGESLLRRLGVERARRW